MIKTKRSLVAAVALLAATSGSFAGSLYRGGKYHSQHGIPSDSKHGSNVPFGLYVNANLGYGYNDIGSGSNIEDDGWAGTLSMGARFNKYAALEAGVIHLPDLKVTSWGESATLHSNGALVSLKGFVPMNETVEGFGSLGFAAVSNSADVDSHQGHYTVDSRDEVFLGAVSLGLNIKVQKNLSVVAQALSTLKKGSEMPATYMGLVGFSYTFT